MSKFKLGIDPAVETRSPNRFYCVANVTKDSFAAVFERGDKQEYLKLYRLHESFAKEVFITQTLLPKLGANKHVVEFIRADVGGYKPQYLEANGKYGNDVWAADPLQVAGYMVTKTAGQGTLSEYLLDPTTEALTPDAIRTFAFQVSYVLSQMHARFGLQHNDIHAGNIGVTRVETEEPLQFELADPNVKFELVLKPGHLRAVLFDFGAAHVNVNGTDGLDPWSKDYGMIQQPNKAPEHLMTTKRDNTADAFMFGYVLLSLAAHKRWETPGGAKWQFTENYDVHLYNYLENAKTYTKLPDYVIKDNRTVGSHDNASGKLSDKQRTAELYRIYKYLYLELTGKTDNPLLGISVESDGTTNTIYNKVVKTDTARGNGIFRGLLKTVNIDDERGYLGMLVRDLLTFNPSKRRAFGAFAPDDSNAYMMVAALFHPYFAQFFAGYSDDAASQNAGIFEPILQYNTNGGRKNKLSEKLILYEDQQRPKLAKLGAVETYVHAFAVGVISDTTILKQTLQQNAKIVTKTAMSAYYTNMIIQYPDTEAAVSYIPWTEDWYRDYVVRIAILKRKEYEAKNAPPPSAADIEQLNQRAIAAVERAEQAAGDAEKAVDGIDSEEARNALRDARNAYARSRDAAAKVTTSAALEIDVVAAETASAQVAVALQRATTERTRYLRVQAAQKKLQQQLQTLSVPFQRDAVSYNETATAVRPQNDRLANELESAIENATNVISSADDDISSANDDAGLEKAQLSLASATAAITTLSAIVQRAKDQIAAAGDATKLAALRSAELAKFVAELEADYITRNGALTTSLAEFDAELAKARALGNKVADIGRYETISTSTMQALTATASSMNSLETKEKADVARAKVDNLQRLLTEIGPAMQALKQAIAAASAVSDVSITTPEMIRQNMQKYLDPNNAGGFDIKDATVIPEFQAALNYMAALKKGREPTLKAIGVIDADGGTHTIAADVVYPAGPLANFDIVQKDDKLMAFYLAGNAARVLSALMYVEGSIDENTAESHAVTLDTYGDQKTTKAYVTSIQAWVRDNLTLKPPSGGGDAVSDEIFQLIKGKNAAEASAKLEDYISNNAPQLTNDNFARALLEYKNARSAQDLPLSLLDKVQQSNVDILWDLFMTGVKKSGKLADQRRAIIKAIDTFQPAADGAPEAAPAKDEEETIPASTPVPPEKKEEDEDSDADENEPDVVVVDTNPVASNSQDTVNQITKAFGLLETFVLSEGKVKLAGVKKMLKDITAAYKVASEDFDAGKFIASMTANKINEKTIGSFDQKALIYSFKILHNDGQKTTEAGGKATRRVFVLNMFKGGETDVAVDDNYGMFIGSLISYGLAIAYFATGKNNLKDAMVDFDAKTKEFTPLQVATNLFTWAKAHISSPTFIGDGIYRLLQTIESNAEFTLGYGYNNTQPIYNTPLIQELIINPLRTHFYTKLTPHVRQQLQHMGLHESGNVLDRIPSEYRTKYLHCLSHVLQAERTPNESIEQCRAEWPFDTLLPVKSGEVFDI